LFITNLPDCGQIDFCRRPRKAEPHIEEGWSGRSGLRFVDGKPLSRPQWSMAG
jgi:hypothetical protein